MSSTKEEKSDLLGTIKVGIGTGLIACVALFSAFLSIDQQLGLPNGLFFKTMHAAFGIDLLLNLFIGFCAAALIGISYNLLSSNWKTFRIITTPKGILTGAVAGTIVFGLLFLPLHVLVFLPAVESNIILNDSLDFSSEEKESLKILLFNSDLVLWYSALLHVIFGSILGLMSGFVLGDRYTYVKRIRSFW
jgi:hypothetical protein